MIPHATISRAALLRGGGELRELRKPKHVWVEFNSSDVRAGLLLSWVKRPGEHWWGEVVVMDERRVAQLMIGAHSLRLVGS